MSQDQNLSQEHPVTEDKITRHPVTVDEDDDHPALEDPAPRYESGCRECGQEHDYLDDCPDPAPVLPAKRSTKVRPAKVTRRDDGYFDEVA